MAPERIETVLNAFEVDRGRFPIVAFGFRRHCDPACAGNSTAGRDDGGGEYRDTIGLITPERFIVCEGSTGPAAASGACEGRATLIPGFHPMWRLDLHKGLYRAFCQRQAECVVHRDGTSDYRPGCRHEGWGLCLGGGLWRGWFGINLHRGSRTGISNDGCQIVPEPDWTTLITLAVHEARRIWQDEWDQRTIPYVLIDASHPLPDNTAQGAANVGTAMSSPAPA